VLTVVLANGILNALAVEEVVSATFVAFVAVVAVVALPDKSAVIVPAAKLPDPSRATTLDTVLASVASTAQVVAAEPLKLLPVK